MSVSCMLICDQKLRPDNALERVSPCCNMVPDPVSLRHWWLSRCAAEDPDQEATCSLGAGWYAAFPTGDATMKRSTSTPKRVSFEEWPCIHHSVDQGKFNLA